MNKRVYNLIFVSLFLTGCATGRTEFRVIPVTPNPTPFISSGEINGPFLEEALSRQNRKSLSKENQNQIVSQSYTVKKGDCLWWISSVFFGDPERYPELVKLNRIDNADLILPGQIIQIAGTKNRQVTSLEKVEQLKYRRSSASSKKIKQEKTEKTEKTINFPQRINKAFAPGEELLFSVEYFGIAAGFATLSVEKGPMMHKRSTIHLVATARTHPAFEWIFKVRDKIESFLDEEGLFSWRYEKHLREGNYKNDSVLIYDQINRKVSKNEGRTVVTAPDWTQDVLSQFYFFRTLVLKIGETASIPVVADNAKTYELVVKVIKKERISVPAGSFDCLVVEPYLNFEGLFKHQGQMHIWVTNDERKVPVLIKSKIAIGSIDIVLRDAVVMDVN